MIKKHIFRISAVLCTAAAFACCPAVSAAEPDNSAMQPAVTIAAEAVDANIAPETVTVADYDNSAYDYYGDGYIYQGSSEGSSKKNWLKIILVALGISAVVTGITVYIIYRGYKYNGMTEPYEYKNKAGLELTVKDDQLIDVHVTSVHINREHS